VYRFDITSFGRGRVRPNHASETIFGNQRKIPRIATHVKHRVGEAVDISVNGCSGVSAWLREQQVKRLLMEESKRYWREHISARGYFCDDERDRRGGDKACIEKHK
jgi:hypothetical protein